MQLLVDAGADVTVAAKGGGTPLHAAAEAGALAIVQVLLRAGANPNAEVWPCLQDYCCVAL